MRTLVEELVYRSCLALDDRDFDRYFTLCAPEFRYRVTAYAPEIRREMTWLDHDRAGLEALIRNLPRHHSDAAPLSRHPNVYTVTFDEGETRATVVSGLLVFRTELDGGKTSLFAVGKLFDIVRIEQGKPLLSERIVRLDTRELGIGSHIPF